MPFSIELRIFFSGLFIEYCCFLSAAKFVNSGGFLYRTFDCQSALSLRHLARRAALGIGRGGTPGGQSSGDLFLAFSTCAPDERTDAQPPLLHRLELDAAAIDPFYLAAVEAVEEAVVNAIVAGEDTPAVKPEGLMIRGIDRTVLAALFKTSQ